MWGYIVLGIVIIVFVAAICVASLNIKGNLGFDFGIADDKEID